MATPLDGAPPGMELVVYQPTAGTGSERHAMHDGDLLGGDIKKQQTDLLSAKESNVKEVLKDLGE